MSMSETHTHTDTHGHIIFVVETSTIQGQTPLAASPMRQGECHLPNEPEEEAEWEQCGFFG